MPGAGFKLGLGRALICLVGLSEVVSTMLVNELAVRAGVPPHVIRYYTRFGLLKPARLRRNAYRDYAESDVYRVRFVRRAKSLGFTLSDIAAILKDADRGISPCPEVRQIIQFRASESRQRLARLRKLQTRVERTVAQWETMPDRLPDHESLCHLIDVVAESKVD